MHAHQEQSKVHHVRVIFWPCLLYHKHTCTNISRFLPSEQTASSQMNDRAKGKEQKCIHYYCKKQLFQNHLLFFKEHIPNIKNEIFCIKSEITLHMCIWVSCGLSCSIIKSMCVSECVRGMETRKGVCVCAYYEENYTCLSWSRIMSNGQFVSSSHRNAPSWAPKDTITICDPSL